MPAKGPACPSNRCCLRDLGLAATRIVAVRRHHGVEVYEPGGIVRFTSQPAWLAVHHGCAPVCRITEAQAIALIEELTPKAEARRG